MQEPAAASSSSDFRPSSSMTQASSPDPRLAASALRPYVLFSIENGSGAHARVARRTQVMIVEDDFLIASEMEGALTQAGFEVTGVASSAEEALELAAKQRPTLAVVDISLRGDRDGVDAALELFAKHGIRCVFATAHHNALTRSRAEPANPLAWLAKPYAMWALVEIVQRASRQMHQNGE